jgi:hypothetical protein
MRKTLVVIGLLALGQTAMAQTPAPAAGGGQGPSGANLPTCSAADATRVRNGETPSTPCRLSSEQQAGSSTSGSSSTTPTPSGGTPAPSR